MTASGQDVDTQRSPGAIAHDSRRSSATACAAPKDVSRTDCVREPALDTRTDAELVSELKSPNGDAIEMLHRRYRGLINRVAVGILRDAAEADDVTQEVFFEIYNKAHQYDASRGSVRTWLLQYAYHRSLRRKAALRLRPAYRGDSLDAAESPPGRRCSDLTQQECGWLIQSGLAQLPTKQRATLELVSFEGLNLQEAARRLGVPWGCARHYYYRGLKSLRKWCYAHGVSAAGGSRAGRRSGGRNAQGRHRR